MRYQTISKECADRLSIEGYALSDGDHSFIDELTMMVLTEDEEDQSTDEELIQRIVRIAKVHLDPVPRNESLQESVSFKSGGIAPTSFWDSLVRFAAPWKRSPKK